MTTIQNTHQSFVNEDYHAYKTNNLEMSNCFYHDASVRHVI